jgi:hypothetical protein
MDIQTVVVVVLVASAALYVFGGIRKSLRGGGGSCGSGCGKCAAPAEEQSRPGMIPLDQVRRTK